MSLPIIDLHCDLLSYLDTAPGSTPMDVEGIGCARPHLNAGGVRLQVMALFALTGPGSTEAGQRQAELYHGLAQPGTGFKHLAHATTFNEVTRGEDVWMLPAIENASCFCGEEEALEAGFARLEHMIGRMGRPLYLTITHHAENRFGGGNMTEVGLKPDGRTLLRHLSGKGIAVDMSHTSDRFAEEILECIDAEGLDIRILASHSNFRPVYGHARNLPDWLSKEIIARGGLIGINFVRDFVNPDRADYLYEHFRYGLTALAAGDHLAFAADYFSPLIMPKESAFREPYFHPEHAHAGKYPQITKGMEQWGAAVLEPIAHGNAWRWIQAGLSS